MRMKNTVFYSAGSKFLVGCIAIFLSLFAAVTASGATFLGPTPYLSQADSPFSLSGLGVTFFLEDFEDHLFNTPGVSASAGDVTSVSFASLHDSVDADDGVIDGSGLDGDSFFSGSGATGITFTFDAGVLGSLPTVAGIVWTDGSGETTFEAFDSLGASLGTIGPVAIADGSYSGETAEDRFFGVIHEDGISAIKISNTGGGIEVDHLQYGQTATPSPTPTPVVSSSPIPSPIPSPLPTPSGGAGAVLGVVNDPDENPFKGVTVTIEG
ncbi:MAG: hypothetical protein HW406_2406, partial [Candidatus Brocadiaceae bacterium]|nr:hypothetical protein [Candidatus Brocadiaceae bacterium]